MELNLDLIVVSLFLVTTLALGIYWGRDVKDIKDYALGGRNFSTATLVSTIVATWIGGDYLFITLSEVYTTGLHYAIGSLGMAFCLYITGYVFIPRMKEFLGNISVAEAMGDLYGNEVRIITAFTGAIAASGFIALQFKVLGDISNFYLGVNGYYAAIVSGIIIVIYSAYGGIRSITFTDVAQFFTFGILIPVLGLVIWNDVNSMDSFDLGTVINQTPMFSYEEYIGLSNPKFWSLLFLWMLFAIPGFDPALFQRIAMGRSIEQVKRAFSISALLVLLILLGMSWISFLLFNLDSTLNPDNLVHYIIDNYANTGLKSFMLIGIIAMCMSSADSNINSASVMLTHDFCYPLNIKFKNELLLSKLFAVALGVVSIILATSEMNMLEMVFMTQSYYTPIAGVPFILAILGFRSTKQVVYIGMGAGFIAVLIWRTFYMDTGIDSIIPGMAANFIFFTLGHYFLTPKRNNTLSIHKDSNNNLLSKNINFNSYLSKLISKFNIIELFKRNAPSNEITYTGFGVFSAISTLCTMYSVSSVVGLQYKNELLLIYEIMLIISISFITYPIWPSSFKKIVIVQIAWNIAIFFLLSVCSSFFVILTDFTPLQFVVFTVNVIAAALMCRWQITIGMTIFGLYLGAQYYKYFTGAEFININLSSTAFILYSLLLSGTTLIIFLKPKQEYLEATEKKVDTLETEVTHLDHTVTNLNNQVSHYSERVADQQIEIERLGATAQKILNNVNHELRLPVGNVVNFSDMLHESLQKSDDKRLQELSDEVVKNSSRLSSMILNMLDLAMLDAKQIELQKSTVNFSELVKERVKNCHSVYLQGKPINFKLAIEPEILISADPNYLRQTVDNLVINAIRFSESGLIQITVKQDKYNVLFTIIDQGKGIPSLELSDIFTPFKMGSNNESKAEGRGVGLALCKAAIEAHGGEIKAKSSDKGATFEFTLPI